MRLISKLIRCSAALIIFLALQPYTIQAGQVSITYHFDEPVIEVSPDGFSRMIFPSTIQAGKAGGPSFPFRGINILLPRGEAVSSVSLQRRGWKDLDKDVILRPRQHPVPSLENTRPENGFLYNSAAYLSTSWSYPPASEFRTRYYRGHAIATGSFSPAGFLPSEKRAGYYSEIEVIVETAPSVKSDRALSMLRTDSSTLDYLKELIDNPTAADLYERSVDRSPSAGDEYEYLIITRAMLENEFEALKDFYNRRGVRTRIMTVEYIESIYPGTDLQEQIRAAVISEYIENGITGLLLAGDGDPGDPATVPYRGLYCSVNSSIVYQDNSIPADIYYAALDGNWNDDLDLLWGEPGEDDLFSEISVGRAPVDSPAEAAIFIHKTTSYQESPVGSQMRDVLLLGEHLYSDPQTYGGNEMDQLVDTCNAYGFSTTGFPPDFNITRYYDRDLGYWPKSVIYDEVNAGTNWICHAGHSNASYVMRLSVTDINGTNFTNDGVTANYPVVYTYGCIAGAFDVNDCIAEEMVTIDNFASAFIGNSRYGWFTEGTTNGPSHHFQREYFDAVFSEGHTTLGPANQRSKDETVPFVDLPDEYEPGAHRWVFYTLNLLGDPAMDSWTDIPSAMQVAHSRYILRGDTSFPLETGVDGALAALYWNGDCYGRGITGPDGTISLPLLMAVPGDVDSMILTVTAHDRYLYRDTLLAVDVAGSEKTPSMTLLYQNHPNPFNPSTVISFALKERCRADLRVYDVSGREVDRILTDILDEGVHSIIWSPRNLASGLYFYRLRARDAVMTRKAILLR
ncbi:MAG: T9SS type A sorting domain-containing protein [Candidatus Krumholzibacteriota bacterium]|nr:T9SS type A sorting domain-containing protein [Candidatus Krumholzibacteriota bacterium]